eukprot:TCONS_00036801-protein
MLSSNDSLQIHLTYSCISEIKMEKRFKSVLDLLARWRFGGTVEDFKDMIKLYLDELKRTTRFKNNRPGKDYVAKFRERMDVTLRTVDKIKSDRFKYTNDELKSDVLRKCDRILSATYDNI